MFNRLAEPPRTCCVSSCCIFLRHLPSQLMLWHIKDVLNFRQIFPFQSGFRKNKIATRLHLSPIVFCFSPTFWETRDQPKPGLFSPSLPLGWGDERPWEQGFPNAIKLNSQVKANNNWNKSPWTDLSILSPTLTSISSPIFPLYVTPNLPNYLHHLRHLLGRQFDNHIVWHYPGY